MCLLFHDYQQTDKRVMTRYSIIDPHGTEFMCLIFHCTKCGKRKVVQA